MINQRMVNIVEEAATEHKYSDDCSISRKRQIRKMAKNFVIIVNKVMAENTNKSLAANARSASIVKNVFPVKHDRLVG